MSTRSKRALLSAFVRASVAPLVIACDEDVLHDPTFRLWCGDHPCAWSVEQGAVQRAATWHAKDTGSLDSTSCWTGPVLGGTCG